jgi:hypothetical protein
MLVAAQSVELLGYVRGAANVENIHVINETGKKFTVTDKNGRFQIPVKLNDVVRVSSIQYENKQVTITQEVLNALPLILNLEVKLTTLETVTVGKVLSGDLSKDIGSVEGKAPVNFYDVGIPGYTGKPLTQSERRLKQAGEFDPRMLLAIPFGGMPLDPLLNSITGRTKMLKARVQHERQEQLITKIRENLSEALFDIIPLEEIYRIDFFYFCEMDENFYSRCHNTIDLEVLEFLKEKLIEYKENQKNKN